ncbi:unnamed protein product [Rotaria sp. Silwood2]|nr:unnamed protein product [Rotaria sp. Silwood2]
MISDGDSSVYEAVKHTYVNLLGDDHVRSNDANDWTVNTNYVVTKEDCVNHVKKRVANHLKTLKSRYTGFENEREENSIIIVSEKAADAQLVHKGRTRRRLPDGKPYGGSNGSMTKSMEQKLSDYYGLAVRQTNLDEDNAVLLMERNCKAAFMHNIKQSDREVQHSLCPTRLDSWCSY